MTTKKEWKKQRRSNKRKCDRCGERSKIDTGKEGAFGYDFMCVICFSKCAGEWE